MGSVLPSALDRVAETPTVPKDTRAARFGDRGPGVFKTVLEVSKSAAQGHRELGYNRERAAPYRCVLAGIAANWGMNWGTPPRADGAPNPSQISSSESPTP
jgi:hypothetical protein